MATQFHSDRGLDDFDAATDLPIFLNLVLEKKKKYMSKSCGSNNRGGACRCSRSDGQFASIT